MRKPLSVFGTILIIILLLLAACESEPTPAPTQETALQEEPAIAPAPHEALAPISTPEPVIKPTPTPTPKLTPNQTPEVTPATTSESTPTITALEAEGPWWKWTGFTSPVPSPEADIPLIDAHSQVDQYVELERVIELIDEAGVAHTILASRATSEQAVQLEESMVSFVADYPDIITPAVRTKGYIETLGDNYPQFLKQQTSTKHYGAMAEVNMYHAALDLPNFTCDAIVMHPDDNNIHTAVNCAIDNKWPFIAHIEFAAAGDLRNELMSKFEALLIQYQEHPFVLNHMGQLDSTEVRRLIEAHPNIHFITAHTNPIALANTAAPWTNMFNGDHLAEDWKQLMIEHPDRFILGFDNVFAEHWSDFYMNQVTLWRKAIKELPIEVAHAFAHGNAERLWHLVPLL